LLTLKNNFSSRKELSIYLFICLFVYLFVYLFQKRKTGFIFIL
jgi:hypothetical protein